MHDKAPVAGAPGLGSVFLIYRVQVYVKFLAVVKRYLTASRIVSGRASPSTHGVGECSAGTTS